MDSMSTVEALKSIIEINEKNLSKNTYPESKIIEIKRETENAKSLLIEKYKDLTYSAAMNFNDYEKWIKSQGNQKSHKTGIDFIDNIFGGDGIHEETFINIVGESGAGKSTLGIKILLNAAKREKAYFISLEMGRFKTYNKIISMIETDKQRENLYIDIWTDDLSKMEREIELFAHNGTKLFLIDSKMKISVSGNEDDHQKISKLSNRLSKLTQKLGIIIMLINQVSEENIKNNRVSIKGSGDQKYDTDLLFSIEMHKKDPKLRVFNLAKNRQNDIIKKVEYYSTFKIYDIEEGMAEMPIIL